MPLPAVLLLLDVYPLGRRALTAGGASSSRSSALGAGRGRRLMALLAVQLPGERITSYADVRPRRADRDGRPTASGSTPPRGVWPVRCRPSTSCPRTVRPAGPAFLLAASSGFVAVTALLVGAAAALPGRARGLDALRGHAPARSAGSCTPATSWPTTATAISRDSASALLAGGAIAWILRAAAGSGA